MKKSPYVLAIIIAGLAISFTLARPNSKIWKPIFDEIGPIINVPDQNSQFGKDIVAAARKQIGIVTEYDTSYFANGEVPENSGVCADVIWRALKEMGYDLQSELDRDVNKNPFDYPNVEKPDSAIDFRRVKNLNVFFDKYAETLTAKVISGDIDNLSQWQAGDLVTFAPLPTSGLTHIAVVSDKRRKDGVPLLIHNYGRGTREDDYLQNWPTIITGHYRLDKLATISP